MTISNDVIREADEQFSVVLSNPTNASIATGTGSVTITDDDLPPTVSIQNNTTIEDFGSVQVQVNLSNASAESISVDVASSNGTATAGLDYEAVAETLTFAPGETTKAVSVIVLSDALDEFDETFNLTLANPVNTSITAGTATVLSLIHI